MTGREWQPGDVAMVTTFAWGNLDARTGKAWLNTTGCWVFADGEIFHSDRADLIEAAHPLVVIDPESDADLARLGDLLYRKGLDYFGEIRRQGLRQALREFASPTPPKPDEPTGLGAVVEAVCGCDVGPQKFIHDPLSTRFEGRPLVPGRTWKSACGHHAWSVLQEVKVLNDGYKPGESS